VPETRAALKRARDGEGPTLLECLTYRWYGHSAMRPDTRAYRTREEELSWRDRDPIALARKVLVGAGVLTEAKAAEIDRAITAEIDAAVLFAENSPEPDRAEMFTDVYGPF